MNSIERLKEFRQKLHETFPKRRDAIMDLIDALSSNLHFRSITQLSLSPFFRRKYNSITKVIKRFSFYKEEGVYDEKEEAYYRSKEKQRTELILNLCEKPESQPFFCFAALFFVPLQANWKIEVLSIILIPLLVISLLVSDIPVRY